MSLHTHNDNIKDNNKYLLVKNKLKQFFFKWSGIKQFEQFSTNVLDIFSQKCEKKHESCCSITTTKTLQEIINQELPTLQELPTPKNY